jgi:hypothetical protein
MPYSGTSKALMLTLVASLILIYMGKITETQLFSYESTILAGFVSIVMGVLLLIVSIIIPRAPGKDFLKSTFGKLFMIILIVLGIALAAKPSFIINILSKNYEYVIAVIYIIMLLFIIVFFKSRHAGSHAMLGGLQHREYKKYRHMMKRKH